MLDKSCRKRNGLPEWIYTSPQENHCRAAGSTRPISCIRASSHKGFRDVLLHHFFVASTAPAVEFGEIATLVVIERMEPKPTAMSGLRSKKRRAGEIRGKIQAGSLLSSPHLSPQRIPRKYTDCSPRYQLARLEIIGK